MFFEFSFPCFGLLWLLIIKKPFLAFTHVLRKIFGSLTRKVWESFAEPRGSHGWTVGRRLIQTPYNCGPIRRSRDRALAIDVIRAIGG